MSEWTVHPAATLFPLLEGPDFEALVTDIREHGLREAIWLDVDGRVLDGRNRLRACEAADVEARFRTYEGDDALGFVVSLNLRRRHLTESQRAMAAARIADMPNHRPSEESAPIGALNNVSQPDAAALFSVSRRSVQRAARVLSGGSEELVAAVDRDDVQVSDAAEITDEPRATQRALLGFVAAGKAPNLKTAKVRRDIDRQRLAIAEGRVDLPAGVFEIIVADPPWPYDNQYDSSHFMGRSANPYPAMSIAELAALELPAADDCVLWLWTTNFFLADAFGLLDAWGFERKSVLTWVKPHIGIGQWLRNRSEHCLLAVKGTPRVSLTNQSTVLEAPSREHSRKPDEFYDMVDTLCVGRKLDLFSRETRPGWAQFGNDATKFGGAA